MEKYTYAFWVIAIADLIFSIALIIVDLWLLRVHRKLIKELKRGIEIRDKVIADTINGSLTLQDRLNISKEMETWQDFQNN